MAWQHMIWYGMAWERILSYPTPINLDWFNMVWHGIVCLVISLQISACNGNTLIIPVQWYGDAIALRLCSIACNGNIGIIPILIYYVWHGMAWHGVA
jgi:hypothetical protein